MKPLHSGFSRGFGALILAWFLLLPALGAQSGPASGKPPDSAKGKVSAQKPRSVAKPAVGTKAVPATGARVPAREIEYADAHPGSHRAASDLALSEDGRHKADALVHFAQALLAEDNAETEKAIEGYLKTLALDPGYTRLAVQVAYELVRRDDVPRALGVLKDSAKAAPKDPLPLIYLAQIYARNLKKNDQALKYAEQAIGVAPDQFGGYLALYELHTALDQGKKAADVLERAAKAKSSDPRFWIQLGDLFTRLYLKDDEAPDDAHVAKMNAIYGRAAELGKEDAVTQARIGDYYVLSRQVELAIPFYVTALRFRGDADDPALNNIRDKLARAYLVTGQAREAVPVLEGLIKEQPMRFETHELLGTIYTELGEEEKAARCLEQTLLIDSSEPQRFLRLAELYLKLNKRERAVEIMRQARAKFSDLPSITFSFAVTLSQAKLHTEAMTAFAEAKADAERSHEEMLNAQFYFQYGAAAEQAGLIDRASELLREAIRLDPANAASAQNYLGYMWVDHDMNLEEAGELIRKALEHDPDNGAYIDSLGWYYYKKGDPAKALVELLRAVEKLTEEDAVVFDHLGDVYHKLGKPAEALRYWQKSIAVEDSPKVREKIAKAKAEPAAPDAPRLAD